MKKLSIVSLLVFILTLTLALPSQAEEKKGKKGGGERITAIEENSITTSVGTYTTSSETKVTIAGKEATLSDLKVGMRVNVTASGDPKAAESIVVQGGGKKKKGGKKKAEGEGDGGAPAAE